MPAGFRETLSMNRFELRAASIDDADVVRGIGLRTFTETFAPANTPENMQLYVESAFSIDTVRREILQEGATTLVLRTGGEDVGYALAARSSTADHRRFVTDRARPAVCRCRRPRHRRRRRVDAGRAGRCA